MSLRWVVLTWLRWSIVVGISGPKDHWGFAFMRRNYGKGFVLNSFCFKCLQTYPDTWVISCYQMQKMLYSIFPTTYNTASWPPNWVRVLPSIFHISLVESSSRVNPETQRGVSCFCCPQARCHVLTAVATAQRSSQYMDTKASWGKEQSVVSETTKRRKCKLCFKSNTFQKSLGCEV